MIKVATYEFDSSLILGSCLKDITQDIEDSLIGYLAWVTQWSAIELSQESRFYTTIINDPFNSIISLNVNEKELTEFLRGFNFHLSWIAMAFTKVADPFILSKDFFLDGNKKLWESTSDMVMGDSLLEIYVLDDSLIHIRAKEASVFNFITERTCQFACRPYPKI